METLAGGRRVKSASGLPGFKPEACTAPGASVADVRMRASRIPGLSLICLGKRPSWLAPGAAPAWGSGTALADGDWPWQGQCFPKAASPWRMSDALAQPRCSPPRRPVFGFAVHFPHADIFYKTFAVKPFNRGGTKDPPAATTPLVVEPQQGRRGYRPPRLPGPRGGVLASLALSTCLTLRKFFLVQMPH